MKSKSDRVISNSVVFYVLHGTKKYTVETLNFCKTWEWNLLISQYYPSLQSQGKDNLAIVMFHITASINSSITVSNETKKPLANLYSLHMHDYPGFQCDLLALIAVTIKS